MGDAEDDATTGISVDRASEQYLDSVAAGNSRKNFQSALTRWRTWLETERGVTTLEELDVLDCRRYARRLKRRARDGELKAGPQLPTVRTSARSSRSALATSSSIRIPEGKRVTDKLPETLGDVDKQL